MTRESPLVCVSDLSIRFHTAAGAVHAVEKLGFEIPAGGTVSLVGESGCGKSVTALSLARLLPEPPAQYASGSIRFDGADVLQMAPAALRDLRGRQIAYVFQEPSTALNPTMRIGRQVAEMAAAHRPDTDPAAEAVRMLDRVHIPDAAARARSYPHELSGGMKQRAMIAMALVCRPRLLVADEPTTALDVTTQAEILALIRELQGELGMAVLLITHNLGLVAETADVICVMYAGRVVEAGPVREILSAPRHPYTRALLDVVPRLQAPSWSCSGRVAGIEGAVPLFPQKLPGCKFAPRCSRAQPCCLAAEPELSGSDSSGLRRVRCFFPLWNGSQKTGSRPWKSPREQDRCWRWRTSPYVSPCGGGRRRFWPLTP